MLRPPDLGGWRLLLTLGPGVLMLLPLLRITALAGLQLPPLLRTADPWLLQLIEVLALRSRLRLLLLSLLLTGAC